MFSVSGWMRIAQCFTRASFLAVICARPIGAQSTPRKSPSRPAPQISGKFLETDGARRVTLAYRGHSGTETFTGQFQSPCLVPDPAKKGPGTPLNLSAIRIGTAMTVFYVRHAATKGAVPENRILAVRFDRVRGLNVPQGTTIPCFKGAH